MDADAFMLCQNHKRPQELNYQRYITVFGTYAKILTDRGASHSFILYRFGKTLGLKTSPLPYPLRSSTPISRDVKLQNVCRACLLWEAGHEFMFELILQDMTDFVVIIR